MNNEIMPFDFGDYRLRAMITDNGEYWFVAKDIAEILDLTNIHMNLQELDEDEKGIKNIYTLGGNQNLTIVSESGLYALIFKSRKPEARRFRKWVTGEVLPALRKTGKYAMPMFQGTLIDLPKFKIPQNLPREVLILRPNTRLKVMQAALQSAKAENAGMERMWQIFVDYCRVMSAPCLE